MSADMKKLACFCTDVAEGSNGSFSYVHRLRKGVNRQSHALKVAHLAGAYLSSIAYDFLMTNSLSGLPPAAISVARNVLLRSPVGDNGLQDPDTKMEMRATG